MKFWLKRSFAVLTLLSLLFVPVIFVACDDDDDDDNTTNPVIYDGLDGTWAITLTPHDTTMGEAATHEALYLYEHGNSLNGYDGVYHLVGTRTGNDLSIDVFNSHLESGEVETHMDLFIVHDDTLQGTGTIIHHAISVPTQEDGTVHEKFQSEHADWDGGEGGVHFYDVIAVRTGPAPDEMLAKTNDRSLSDNGWCDFLYGTSSFLISYLSGDRVRPFSDCWFSADGGGFYLYGQNGPGSITPFYTQTIYLAWEYAWCGSRTYHFTLSLGGPVTGWDLIEETSDMDPDYISPLNLSHTEFGQRFQEMADIGRFAICAGYSTHTHNTSIYILTDQGSEVWDADLVMSYDDSISDAAPGGIWRFSGSTIHDTWSMTRSLTGVCNSQIIFTYLIGTHNVYFD